MTQPYLAHFDLKESPFTKEVPDGELWLPSSKLAVVEALLDALDEHASVVLVGEPGVGKTCVLRALRHRIPAAGFRLTYCHNATLGRRDFYRQLCQAVGLSPVATAGGLFYALSRHVEERAAERVHPVFLLDEAHLMHQDTLDHLHILLNYAWDRRSLGAALRGDGGHRDYSRAARDYVSARGGGQRASQSASSARGATARLAGFLSNVSTGGFAAAVQRLGLRSLAGRPAHDVMAAITNALAPRGATLADAATRQAIADTLAELWELHGVVDGGLDRLQAMTADDVRAAITASVSAYIFYQWVLELGRAIERQAVSTNQAITMEREMRQYIHDTLTLDLAGTDVLTVEWSGAQGQAIISKVYADAFGLIESA